MSVDERTLGIDTLPSFVLETAGKCAAVRVSSTPIGTSRAVISDGGPVAAVLKTTLLAVVADFVRTAICRHADVARGFQARTGATPARLAVPVHVALVVLAHGIADHLDASAAGQGVTVAVAGAAGVRIVAGWLWRNALAGRVAVSFLDACLWGGTV
jgi:hypothetical protein